MTREAITHLPEFYKAYVQLSPDMPLVAALHESRNQLHPVLEEELASIGDKVYAAGKWRIPVMLQHLIDTERIMAYRALRFARKDKTPLPGFDENNYADATLHTKRKVKDLMEELRIVRAGTVYLFESFDDEALQQYGPANGADISVGALGYVIAGHAAHHLKVIKERYMPLVKAAATH